MNTHHIGWFLIFFELNILRYASDGVRLKKGPIFFRGPDVPANRQKTFQA